MLQKHWPIFIALCLSSLGIMLIIAEPYSSELLAYQRVDILNGELWRLFTCNFHHTNFMHLLMNSGGLIVITLLHQQHYKKWTQVIVLSSTGLLLAISLLAADPQLYGYLGLSGALHGLFAWGVIEDIRKGDKTGYLLLAGLIAKLAWEGFMGASQNTEALIGAKVATNSHLFGAIWGLILALSIPKLAHKKNL